MKQRLGGPNEAGSKETSDSTPKIIISSTSSSSSNDGSYQNAPVPAKVTQVKLITHEKQSPSVQKHDSDSSESHTPPLPGLRKGSTEEPRSDVSSNRAAAADDKSSQDDSKDKKLDDNKSSKKANEWDMFAEADNVGDFSVSCFS